MSPLRLSAHVDCLPDLRWWKPSCCHRKGTHAGSHRGVSPGNVIFWGGSLWLGWFVGVLFWGGVALVLLLQAGLAAVAWRPCGHARDSAVLNRQLRAPSAGRSRRRPARTCYDVTVRDPVQMSSHRIRRGLSAIDRLRRCVRPISSPV